MFMAIYPDKHQHGFSVQISINLGKKILRISSIRKIAVTCFLARVFAYLPSFFLSFWTFIYLLNGFEIEIEIILIFS